MQPTKYKYHNEYDFGSSGAVHRCNEGELLFHFDEDNVAFFVTFENVYTGAEFTQTFQKEDIVKLQPILACIPQIVFNMLRKKPTSVQIGKESVLATFSIQVADVPMPVSFSIPKKQYEGDSDIEELRQEIRVLRRRVLITEGQWTSLQNAVATLAEKNLTPDLFTSQFEVNKPIIEAYLVMGADVNAAPMGVGHPTNIVFKILSYWGYPEATRFLLKNDADVNMKNPGGKHEPILVYLFKNRGPQFDAQAVEHCRLLIEYNADLELEDDEKRDAFWTCAEALQKNKTSFLKEVMQIMERTRYPTPSGRGENKKQMRGGVTDCHRPAKLSQWFG